MNPRRRTQPPTERSKLKNVALFAEEEESSIPHTLPLDQITLPPTQPRRYFDPKRCNLWWSQSKVKASSSLY